MENLMVYGQLDIACTSIANKKHQVNLTDLDFTFSETFEPGWRIFDIYGYVCGFLGYGVYLLIFRSFKLTSSAQNLQVL